MPEEELIEPDDIHDAVIVNGIDRYSDISEPASPRAAATLDILAAAEAAAATGSRRSDTDESFVVNSSLSRKLTLNHASVGISTTVARCPPGI